MSDLTPDQLIQQWIRQDNFEAMAKSLLFSGVELGTRSTLLVISEMILAGEFDWDAKGMEKVAQKAMKKATSQLEEKLDARRPKTK